MLVRELFEQKSTSLDLDMAKVAREKGLFMKLVRAYRGAVDREEAAFQARHENPDAWRRQRDKLATSIAIADREFVRHFVQRGHMSFTLADFDTSDPARLWQTFTAV